MKRFLLIFVLALLAAACGGEQISEQIAEGAIGGNADVEISGDGDDFSINVESDDGSLSLGSGASLPDEMEIPVPDGGDVTMAGTQGTSVFAAVSYPKDRYDEIVAFYDSWTDGAGGEWQTQTATVDFGGQTQRTAAWNDVESNYYILVSDCAFAAAEGNDLNAVCVTVNQN
jgi:hypothetical protein